MPDGRMDKEREREEGIGRDISRDVKRKEFWGAPERAWRVKCLLLKPGDLSSVPGVTGWKNMVWSPKLFSDHVQASGNPHYRKINIIGKKL